jgi:hypothetical protein
MVVTLIRHQEIFLRFELIDGGYRETERQFPISRSGDIDPFGE